MYVKPFGTFPVNLPTLAPLNTLLPIYSKSFDNVPLNEAVVLLNAFEPICFKVLGK